MKFDNKMFVSLYDKQQHESGYPGKLLPFVLEQLKDYYSIIDIGAGSGFFAIPLLKNGHAVTAVEPSSYMTELITDKAKGMDSSKLALYRLKWEDWTGPSHEASISIHSFYPMSNRKLALEKMLDASSRRIIIIRNSRQMRTITGLVRSELKLHESPDLNDELSSLLEHYKINFTVTVISEERDTVIHSIDNEVESIMFRTDIPAGLRGRVKEIILQNSRSDGNVLLYNSFFSDNAYVF